MSAGAAKARVSGGVRPSHWGGARVGQFGSVSLLGEGAKRLGTRNDHGAGACHGALPARGKLSEFDQLEALAFWARLWARR